MGGVDIDHAVTFQLSRDWHIGCVLAFQASQRSSILLSRSKMTLDEVKNLSNRDLLELYADMVRVCHYDPCETPRFAKALWENGIGQGELAALVLKRMKND